MESMSRALMSCPIQTSFPWVVYVKLCNFRFMAAGVIG